MDEKLLAISRPALPFNIFALQYKLKLLGDFVLWATPKEKHDESTISNNSTQPNTDNGG